ncbi:MAG: 2-isopropylmalate synthase [Armatimonadetes bacterium RBG_16_58_9]|nr:MAG: 2-isopropylmalate synthase [Armatimonadetes bacterium RBG_16_58_9]
MRRIRIFDTTLRDGEQSPGASMNIEEKLGVARQLARLKVDVIEAGFPISSQGDFDAVKAVAEAVKGPAIAGLCRASDADIDRAWEAVKPAKNPLIHTFIATSDIHLEKKLKKTREQVLDLAVAAVKRAKGYCENVEFSAEDASRSDFDYLCQVVEAVIDAGATVVNIPDTVGYAIPDEFGAMIAGLFKRVPNIKNTVMSVHCHNDLGLAVANSLAAVKAGAGQVECTVNGIGERAGNAALEEIVMAIDTRRDLLNVRTGVNTREIHRASRLVSDVTGLAVQVNKAVVGSNAFAHEAGIHQHGVLQEKRTYEIMDAEAVGLSESKLVLGKHSGRHAFEDKLKSLGYHLNKSELDKAFERFKELADKKKEVFAEDLEAIVADEVYVIPSKYRLEYMNVMTSLGGIPTATIRLNTDDTEIVDAGIGVGSVDAVYKTIDKMVNGNYTLVDFIVKSVTGGTDALGEVTVKLAGRNDEIYTGRGASLDIVEASAKAYLNAINKLVYYEEKRGGGGKPKDKAIL